MQSLKLKSGAIIMLTDSRHVYIIDNIVHITNDKNVDSKGMVFPLYDVDKIQLKTGESMEVKRG